MNYPMTNASMQVLNYSFAPSPPLPLAPSRCNPTAPPCTARTCWTTPAAWFCWSWASCCSPRCWCWPWPPTAAWRATSSWACASSRTAVPSTRTCPPHAGGGAPAGAAAASRGAPRGRGRAACGCREEECIWL